MSWTRLKKVKGLRTKDKGVKKHPSSFLFFCLQDPLKPTATIDQNLGILAFRHQLRTAVEGPLAEMYGILYFYFRVHFSDEVLV